MQKTNIFPKILYYLCTFLLGIFLVFTMPYFFTYDIVLQKTAEHLVSGEYREAMQPLAIYFNSEPALDAQLNNGKVVIFESLSYGLDEEGKEDRSQVRAIYTGFLFDVNNFKVSTTEENAPKLLVVDDSGNKVAVDLSVYNVDKNGLLQGYAYFWLDKTDTASVSQLSFVDSNGESYLSVDNANLNFNTPFFTDIAPISQLYNGGNATNEEMQRLNDEFLAKDDNYSKFSEEEAKKIADTRSAIIIVVYFVVVYVIADFLLGRRYILRFFRWFIYDVCKAKPRKKKAKSNNDIFGHDYYCMVTVSLDLEAVPDFDESVQVRYTNSDVEIAFILLKENGYTATERVKAGTYVNPFIDMNREYAPVDLPDNLEVEGFKMETKIKIIRRED